MVKVERKRQKQVEVNSDHKKIFENGKLKTIKKKGGNKKPVVIKTEKEVSLDDFLEGVKDLPLNLTQDTYGMYSVKNNKKVLTYVLDTKYGMSYYNMVNGSWKAEKITAKKQLDIKINQIRKTIESKELIDASLVPIYHCGFEDCVFQTDDKSIMKNHIRDTHI